MPERPPAPLGRHIDDRRNELGLTLKELAVRSGISVEQLRAVRYGENIPRGLTRTAIERALQWAPRSIDGILDHDSDPVPLAAAAAVAPAAAADGAQYAATIAAIRLVYTGADEGDEAAIVAAVRRTWGDGVPVSIMSQGHKDLDQRWRELNGWLAMNAAAQA